ncbi:vacuolar protein-sorting-associated protein 25-like [Oppia nitens]|uniref:vacuolar protein-sorting-associated protein 25-like n=1 Tax=Oppia nitens TaxID=1686743 RepID=UPI0023DBBA89|nr:vacuolar protein-sorting-associated protein 25-like [Oppia nitens]
MATIGANQVLDKSFHYNFEPFFTIQPNIETRRQQLKAWRQLICDYYEVINEHVLDVNKAINDPIFKNNKISRQLSLDSLRVILDDMQSNGLIEWIDKKQDNCYVYWKRPQDWAQLVLKWVDEKALNNTVCTFYEIVSSDETKNYPFHGLNEQILIKALQCLEKQGKAVLMSFDNNSGVKFL